MTLFEEKQLLEKIKENAEFLGISLIYTTN